jgi:Ala-tRNA(Pro) deacylase
MRPRSLDQFLKHARVPYTTFRHPAAFSAQNEAQLSHVPGRSWAKIVVCFADDEPILVVVPAPLLVDLDRLREMTGARAVRLASEPDLVRLYPDCEPGAMPPFGPLYFQRVFVDKAMVGETDMVFNAGTHTDAIRMHYGDFAEMTRPIVGTFACPRPARVNGSPTPRIRKRPDSRRSV